MCVVDLNLAVVNNYILGGEVRRRRERLLSFSHCWPPIYPATTKDWSLTTATTTAVITTNLNATTEKNGSRRFWWRLFLWLPIRRSLQAGWNGFVKSTKPITWPAAASVGTNADHRLQHRPTWNLEDPWTHRETVIACASPDANQFRSLILRLLRYELSIPRIYLVSLLSRARLLKFLWKPESTVAFFVVSQRSQTICRSLYWMSRTEIPPENPKLKKS